MKQVQSYLEFGSQSGNKRKPYDIRYGQEAYEFLMVARYLKDIMCYRAGDIGNVYHKEDLLDNIKKYTALLACKKNQDNLTFYEIGSSLMGVIDSLEYIDKRVNKLNFKNILFVGVDNSKMMNFAAAPLHNNYKLKLFEKVKNLKSDLFFAKGVSLLYSIKNEEEFCNILKNSKISIFDYTFSLKGKLETFVGTGKYVTYLSLKKFKDILKDKNKSLILTESKRKYNLDKGLMTYECTYGDKATVKKYLSQLEKISLIFKKELSIKR